MQATVGISDSDGTINSAWPQRNLMHRRSSLRSRHNALPSPIHSHILHNTLCQHDASFTIGYVPLSSFPWLAVWLSGNTLASINVVVLRHTQLVPGWVTDSGRVNHLGM